jgi:hypothetical protein
MDPSIGLSGLSGSSAAAATHSQFNTIQFNTIHATTSSSPSSSPEQVSDIPGDSGHMVVAHKYAEEVEGVARMRATPTSRSWIITYALLTWLMSISFCSVAIHVFWTTDNHKGAVQNINCLEMTPHLANWTGVQRAYNVSKLPATIANYSAFQVSSLLDVLKAMNCSGNGLLDGYALVQNATTGLMDSLTLPGKEPVLSKMFYANSAQCGCVVQQHVDVLMPILNNVTLYFNASTEATYKARFIAAINTYLLDGNQPDSASTVPVISPKNYPSLVRHCFMNKRPAQFITIQEDCATTVIPYNVVAFINVVAGMFAAIYIIQTFPSESEGVKDNSWAKRIMDAMSHWIATAVFVLLNFSLGLTALVVTAVGSGASSKSVSYWFGILSLIVIGLVISLIRTNLSTYIAKGLQSMGITVKAPFFFTDKAKRIKAFVNTQERRADVMRLVFWIHYVMLLPAFVMLLDHVQQNRVGTWTMPRFFTCMGLAFLAVSTDLCYLLYEYTLELVYERKLHLLLYTNNNHVHPLNNGEKQSVYDELHSKHLVMAMSADDGARSAVWWAWGSWCFVACSLFVMEAPMKISPAILDPLVPSSVFPLATAVLVLGIPMFAKVPLIHEENTKAYTWQGDRSTMALALCLGVEFVARLLLTLSVVYWTVF